MVVSPEEVRWDLYPHIATHPHAKAFSQWLVLNARRPKTIDAYARAIDSFLKTFPEPERLIEANKAGLLSYLASLKQRASHLMNTAMLLHLFMQRRQMQPWLSVRSHSASSTTFSSGVSCDVTRSIPCREDRLEVMGSPEAQSGTTLAPCPMDTI